MAGGDGVAFIPDATRQLFLARRVAAAMLRKRGFAVRDDDVEMGIDEFCDFCDRARDDPEFEFAVAGPKLVAKRGDETIVVLFPDGKVDTKRVVALRHAVVAVEATRAIVVTRNKISAKAESDMCAPFTDDATAPGAELFSIEQLQTDITEHALIPPHRVLGDSEVDELLKRHRLKPTQLPRMFPTDPIARFYGLQRGQVLQVANPSDTAGVHLSYRIVR